MAEQTAKAKKGIIIGAYIGKYWHIYIGITCFVVPPPNCVENKAKVRRLDCHPKRRWNKYVI